MGCINAKAAYNKDFKSCAISEELSNKLSDKFSFMYPSENNKEEPYLYDIPYKGKDDIL